MFGFGKKKKKKIDATVQTRMHVIPDIFYGGRDPVIYHEKKTAKAEVKKSKRQPRGKKASGPSWVTVHKKKLMLGGAGIVFSIVAVSAWYYIGQAIKSSSAADRAIIEPIVEEPEEIPLEVEPVEDIVSPTTTVAVEEEEIPLEVEISDLNPVSFPRILLVDAPDGDSDELTDDEEVIFSTNMDVWDSDGDGYYDGQEVINLYNPNGLAPVKLIDSGLVAEYINPVWKYRVYYPVAWKVGEVDLESRQVLFSTLSGDYVEARVIDRVAGSPFQEWFSLQIEGEKFQDVSLVTNRFKEEQWRRKDGLVGYILSETHVTILVYHPGVTGAVPYRSIMRMMLESFRPTNTTVTIPDQVLLPAPPTFEPPTATSTSVPIINTSTVEA